MKKNEQDAKELHDNMIVSLVMMYELQQGEYLCIGYQEDSGFEIYKNKFVMLDKTVVDAN